MECKRISLEVDERSGLDENGPRRERRAWSHDELEAATVLISCFGKFTPQAITGFAEESPMIDDSPLESSPRSKASSEPDAGEPRPQSRPLPASLSPSSWVYLTPPPDPDVLRNLTLNGNLKSTVAEFCLYCSHDGHRLRTCPELRTKPLPCCRVLDFSDEENELPEIGTEAPPVEFEEVIHVEPQEVTAPVIPKRRQPKERRGPPAGRQKKGNEALRDHNYSVPYGKNWK